MDSLQMYSKLESTMSMLIAVDLVSNLKSAIR